MLFSAQSPVWPAARLALFTSLFFPLAAVFDNTWGPVTVLVVAAVPLVLLACFSEVHRLLASLLGRKAPSQIYMNLALALCASGFVLASAELLLQVHNSLRAPAADGALAMPEGWRKKPVAVKGGQHSYYWHGNLHVHDERGLRRVTPLPPKEEGRCRIAVFGDSLTYGYGVAEEETYSALLEEILRDEWKPEVLNLGVSGRQSEDVLTFMKELVPILEPDLVVYGVCLNDFLDSSEGEEYHRRRYTWPFPFPDWFKREMKARTLAAGIFETGYDALLMKTGVRLDFYDDVLKDFDGYQKRFGTDVRNMNTFVRERGLPPVTAMVLDQVPVLEGRGHRMARVAERLMEEAGMGVVSTEGYYRDHDGRNMMVSPWEGHPNSEAHALFADLLARHLRARGLPPGCTSQQ